MKKVGIVMGSASDLPVVEKAIKVLQEYAVPFEVRVLSAHRCPDEAREFAASARESGFSVLIGAAGMAAHLAGALAANTTLPVIGIPCKSSVLDGMDALLATVQMPSGIPVATVAIDGAKNAAILAMEIMDIFRRFGEMRNTSPESSATQALVRELQEFYTAHFYNCTNKILLGLAAMYDGGGEFTESIDSAAGEGTAAFAAAAIRAYTEE